MKLRALVLAGGASERFGHNKLISEHPKGGTLVGSVLRAITPLSIDTLVVTGKWHHDIEGVLATQPVVLSYNDQWQHGIGASVAHGVATLMHHWPDTTHIFVCVGDLPAVTEASLKHLKDTAEAHPQLIVASQWDGTVGVPAIFPVRYKKTLCSLNGDRGAARLIHQQLATSPPGGMTVSHPEAKWDIDYQGDWHR